MNIQVSTQSIKDSIGDALVVGAIRRSNGQGIQLTQQATLVDGLLDGLLSKSAASGEFKAQAGELLTLHPQGRLAVTRVLVVGLGNEQKLRTQGIRHASACAARHLQATGAQSITLALDPTSTSWNSSQLVQAQVEGALLGLYTFRIYQQSSQETKSVQTISVLSTEALRDEAAQAIKRGQIYADGTNLARDLVNEPPNVLSPGEMANRASAMAKAVGLEYEVLEKEQMTKLGMGGLLAVAQGSAEPPYLIILRYRGAPDQKSALALVGKGITFDTGGISIKPADHMDEMKGDMGGAAAVIGAMQAIARLKPRINVTALIPTCENMPSGTAYRPGDILRISNGKTIEIVNTDAEGRLILADALSYAVKQGLSPIIDLATLTGGVVVALGETTTGLFSNDEALTSDILAAARETGEKYWPMPMDDEYRERIQSDIADIKQSGGRIASSITAAKILEQFVDNTTWAHLDIAGTSYVESRKPYQEKGGTGVGVRTLAEFVVRQAQR